MRAIREEKTREEARYALRKEAISPSLRIAEMGELRLLPSSHNCAVVRGLRVGISRKKKMLPSTVLGSEEAHSEGDQSRGKEENGISMQ